MKNIFSKMVLVLILLGAFLQAGNVWTDPQKVDTFHLLFFF